MNIIYRDLKPQNIGFDVRGDVKIFDLGFAKEVPIDEKLPDGTFKLKSLFFQ
jgi:serine/threonine protein kinase